jgi:VanZ family protein
MPDRGWWRAWWPVLAWAAFIFVLSSIPGTKLPEVKTPHADKIVHAAVYLVLGALCLRAIRRTSRLTGARAVAVATLLAALYGISDELHQIFTPFRTADWHDAAADTAGGLAGALAAVTIRSRRTSRRNVST